jgi:hypothetical protein
MAGAQPTIPNQEAGATTTMTYWQRVLVIMMVLHIVGLFIGVAVRVTRRR